MSFANTWNSLQANLMAEAVIPNWTVDHGLIGEPFTVIEVSSDSVTINAPGATTAQKVPREEFEVVYDCWTEYVHRRLPRSTLNPLTRHSKYVISILHWLENANGGNLP